MFKPRRARDKKLQAAFKHEIAVSESDNFYYFIQISEFRHRFFVLICIAITTCFATSNFINCDLYPVNYVWGDHIDYFEWSCNVNDIIMSSNIFNKTHDYNNVTSMFITKTTNTSLPKNLHQKFAKLSNLRVEMTDLKLVTSSGTHGMRNLRNMYLGKNQIEHVSEDAFHNTPELIQLYLNSNQIKHLSPATFRKLPRLERLWLGHNQLTELHAKLLLHNQNLKSIYLNNNKLTVIGADAFKIPTLKAIDLGSNICINRHTFNTHINTVKQLVEKNCNPKVENMRQSAIVLGKILQELSERDIARFNERAINEAKIDELEEKLEKLKKPHNELSSEEFDYELNSNDI